MNLQKVNECISLYKKIIKTEDYDGWTLWELTYRFQDNWDIDHPDFAVMFDNSFKVKSPLWFRDGYFPIETMKRYIQINEDFVRSMFQDLYNDNREISGRITRFLYQCDEMYKIDRSQTQKVVPHFHDDRRMIHTYLAFRFPDEFAMYNFALFKSFMANVGSKSIPLEEDIDRFLKVCKTLNILIHKDDELLEMVKEKVASISCGELYPMLLVFEIYSLTDELH